MSLFKRANAVRAYYKAINQEASPNVKPEISPSLMDQVTVQQIHDEFDSAVDSLLPAEPKVDPVKLQKHDNLKKLGFTNAKDVKDAAQAVHEKSNYEHTKRLIERYTKEYPNHKFIAEHQVGAICQKYGLIKANIERYTGSVPDKNVQEIMDFNLKTEDYAQYSNDYYGHTDNQWGGTSFHSQIKGHGMFGYLSQNDMGRMIFTRVQDQNQSTTAVRPSLQICAPVTDFNTAGMQIVGYDLLAAKAPDPIVLQPVSGGYLIVSKWGIEANDQELVIPANN